MCEHKEFADDLEDNPSNAASLMFLSAAHHLSGGSDQATKEMVETGRAAIESLNTQTPEYSSSRERRSHEATRPYNVGSF